MARPKIKRKGIDWKALLMSEEKDLLKSAVQEMVQEILEAEMDETVGARKGERTTSRTGYRSGYYTRGLGELESSNCKFPKIDKADSARKSSNDTNEVRRRWSHL